MLLVTDRAETPVPKRMAHITCRPSSRQVWLDGTPLDLTTMEYEIMARLVQSAGTIVARERLMSEVFDRPVQPENRALDVHISNLRRKLGQYGFLIVTVRGIGHMLRVAGTSGPR
jgi:DNA-binding response OmpR family regulator